MRAVIADRFDKDGKGLRVAEVEQPKLTAGEVLIDVSCSSIHPADAMMIAGVYDRGAVPPFRAGLSGVGRVVAAKGTVLGQLLKGRRVVFAFPDKKFGAWAEQITTVPSLCAPIPDDLDDASAVNLLTNGATAIGIAERLAAAGANGAVVTGAAGDFARLIRKRLHAQKRTVICVVRSDVQAEALRQDGEMHVLNMMHNDFDEVLAETSARLGVKGAVDSLAGDMPERLIRALPIGSTVLMIGRLTGQPLTMDAMEALIARDGTVQGFHVGHWFSDKSRLGAHKALREATTMLKQNPPPPPRHIFDLDELVERFAETQSDTSMGKTIVQPGGVELLDSVS